MSSKNAQVFAEIQTQLDALVPAFIDEFIPRVRFRTPRVTGKLQEGWYGRDEGGGVAYIGNDVDYAPYVEYGTYKMAPRGMLQTTLEESDQILDIARKKAGL